MITAAAYLPLASKLGFYNDDWYLLYAGNTQGIEKFSEIFAIDRPARAVLVSFFYQLFGNNAALYNYSAYVFRLAGVISFLIILQTITPKHRLAAYTGAVLFAVYPGFLDQPNAFDYQSHIVSFSLVMGSIAFTVKGIQSQHNVLRVVLFAGAVILGLIYPLLMEYYIGLEAFRVFLIIYLVWQKKLGGLKEILRNVLLFWLPNLVTTAGFLFWRIVVFSNNRAATDIGGMISSLVESPVMRGLWSIVYIIQDFLNIVATAWFVPLYEIAFRLRLREFLIGLLIGGVSLLLGYLLTKSVGKQNDAGSENGEQNNWQRDWILLGAATVLTSLIPITLGDRHILYPAYSRFTLPGSAGGVMILVGLLFLLNKPMVTRLISIGLIGLAVLTHYGNASRLVEEWNVVKDFWWQVSWRVPQIKPGTTLLADYPIGGIAESYFIWGPANMIYYPEKKSQSPTAITLPAALMTPQSVQKIMIGKGQLTSATRSFLVEADFEHVLILSMPLDGSCVHIIDGHNPELSIHEEYRTMLIAGKSEAGLVIVDQPARTPPVSIFGPEPSHKWCYYYQKADLARQQRNWKEVVRLGDEASRLKLHPVDWVEWMPFIQAYAYLGREDKVFALEPIIKDNIFLHEQACKLFREDGNNYGNFYPKGQELLVRVFCEGVN
ncbi:MAG TPA: hypothetical protein VIO61_10470 [Anaerolineaceae bacterium]